MAEFSLIKSYGPKEVFLWILGVACFVGLIVLGTYLSTFSYQVADETAISGVVPVRSTSSTVDDWPDLRVVIAPPLSSGRTAFGWREFLDWFGAKLHRRIVIVESRDCASTSDVLISHDADIGILCSSAGQALQDATTGTVMLASLGSMKQVGPATRSYIIVSSSSTVRSFSELHGHSMVFLDPESIVGGAYPAYRALNDGYQAASFFSKIKYSYSLEDSLSIVSLGIEDAGAIDGSFWDLVAIEDPDVIKKLRVIERSPWVGTPVVVASSDLSTSLQSQMMNVLLDASTDPDAVRILKNLQYNRFFPYDASRYTEIDRMVSALKEHKEWPLPTQL